MAVPLRSSCPNAMSGANDRRCCSFLLKVETLRRVVRVASLLALDYIGVTGALFTALSLKLALQGKFDLRTAWQRDAPVGRLRLPGHGPDVRAGGSVRRTCPSPGMAKIASALFQATVIALVFALANGDHFSSYYIFYGSLFFGIVYIAVLRELYLRITGRLLERAGYRRRALLVGSGKHIEAVAHALDDRARTHVDLVGYISLTPRPENGLRSLGTAAPAHRDPGRRTHPGGDHRRPRLPPRASGRSRRPLPPTRRDRACRTLDDGDPDRPSRVRPGPDGPAVHAAPAGLRGHRLRAQADLRPRALDARADPALADPAGDRRGGQAELRGAR